MNFDPKHIRHFKVLGFFILLGIMVVLNNRIDNTIDNQGHSKSSTEVLNSNNLGVTPLTAQLPLNPEGSLPIKLITNTNTNFLVFSTNGYEFKNECKFLQLKKQFLSYCSSIKNIFFIEYLVSTRNKDIR